jgi:hypothetical protein
MSSGRERDFRSFRWVAGSPSTSFVASAVPCTAMSAEASFGTGGVVVFPAAQGRHDDPE